MSRICKSSGFDVNMLLLGYISRQYCVSAEFVHVAGRAAFEMGALLFLVYRSRQREKLVRKSSRRANGRGSIKIQ
jgi:hypothetical protein